ncbi:MAG TPA: hypothetical protein VGV16_02610 [Gammaproteobacteria bacterium]|nr:hypothetical protein [Gammaproteobacteria bacterium]
MKTFIACLSLLLIAPLAGNANADTVRYRIIDLGNPLGGTGVPFGIGNLGNSINDLGWVAGEADLPGSTNIHAELWLYGFPLDLGTLGGPNSAVAWPNRNNNGVIAGISETAKMQPRGEQWSCAAAIFYSAPADGHICVGFVWEDGRMWPLPTLGGDNGFATGINNARQIVGWAEDTVRDPTCTRNNQVLQFEAVMWTWKDGRYQAAALPAYGTDRDGAATAINQAGEVVGISGVCGGAVGADTAEHMVIWQDGKILTTIPTLGGGYWNTPMDINDVGEVVGFSDMPGDGVLAPNFQAFLWSAKPFDCNGMKITGTCNLGVLPGDALSESLGVNNHGQVVGISLGSTPYGQAFLYEDGKLQNLNSLTLPGTTLFLTDAQDINDEGVITGQAYDPASGVIKAFMAIPVPAGG